MMIRAYSAMKAELTEYRKSGLSPEQVQELMRKYQAAVKDIEYLCTLENGATVCDVCGTNKSMCGECRANHSPEDEMENGRYEYYWTWRSTREEAEKAIGGGQDG